MRNRIESRKTVPARAALKSASNWMQLEIAPLIAQRMICSKPLPGSGR